MWDVGTRLILTPRLQLRRHRPEDAADLFCGWAGSSELARLLHCPPLADLQQAAAVVRGWCFAYDEEPDFYRWAITLRGSGALIGSIHLAAAEGFWEPSYVISPRRQGQGYAKEALKAALAYLVDAAGADRFIARHLAENTASGAVLSAAGFLRIAPPPDRAADCVWYRLDAGALVRDVTIALPEGPVLSP